MEAVAIQCSNFYRNSGLYLKDKIFKEIFTQFVLNSVLYHVGLSWIITSNKHIKYETEEKIPDWLNKGPWYNTTICSKLYGTVFKYYIRNDRTKIYNIMCSITAHDRKQPTYVDDASSSGGR